MISEFCPAFVACEVTGMSVWGAQEARGPGVEGGRCNRGGAEGGRVKRAGRKGEEAPSARAPAARKEGWVPCLLQWKPLVPNAFRGARTPQRADWPPLLAMGPENRCGF